MVGSRSKIGALASKNSRKSGENIRSSSTMITAGAYERREGGGGGKDEEEEEEEEDEEEDEDETRSRTNVSWVYVLRQGLCLSSNRVCVLAGYAYLEEDLEEKKKGRSRRMINLRSERYC